MTLKATESMQWCAGLFVAAAFSMGLATAAAAHQDQHESTPSQPTAAQSAKTGQEHDETTPAGTRLLMPSMNAAQGRKLFADKGCVACHAINGVGGHDATPLDAHTMDRAMNPFEFAAKMWRMAPVMIAAQEQGLGYQIHFTGDELASIIAFVHDDEEQHKFSEADITPKVRKMMNHSHGQPGSGGEAHGEELGHKHDDGMHKKHHVD